MSGGRNTSFFSFGVDDAYIARSYEGLKYRDLPPSLNQLILSGSVVDVYWASLGPIKESWVLSFRDREAKDNLAWGPSIPVDLLTTLTSLAPSPHIRVSLGPKSPGSKDSFIAWSPSFIRWAGLPSALEACLQSWLTPAGWKAGPPRLMTWGPKSAWFAMSEYGDLEWSTGSREIWGIWRETVEEWDGEGFEWRDLAYISMDPTTPDQFMAIRSDRTWAGSISDSNEDALESFALNFFSRAKGRSHTRTQSQPNFQSHSRTNSKNFETNSNNFQPNSPPPRPNSETVPDAATQALYERWATGVATSFASALAANTATPTSPPPSANIPSPGMPVKPRPKKLQIRNPSSRAAVPQAVSSASGQLLTSFPYLPPTIATCTIKSCAAIKAEQDGLRACKHDIEKLFRASGLYSYEWLRQERIRWHPDRFGRLCEERWRETGRKLAEEMFKVIDGLLSDLQRATNGHV